jgi:hypothetical protein
VDPNYKWIARPNARVEPKGWDWEAKKRAGAALPIFIDPDSIVEIIVFR